MCVFVLNWRIRVSFHLIWAVIRNTLRLHRRRPVNRTERVWESNREPSVWKEWREWHLKATPLPTAELPVSHSLTYLLTRPVNNRDGASDSRSVFLTLISYVVEFTVFTVWSNSVLLSNLYFSVIDTKTQTEETLSSFSVRKNKIYDNNNNNKTHWNI